MLQKTKQYSPHKRCSEKIAARSFRAVKAQWSYRCIVAVFGNLGLNARQPAASVHGAKDEMLKFWGRQDVTKIGNRNALQAIESATGE